MSGTLQRLEAEAKKRNLKYFCFAADGTLTWRQRLRRAYPSTRYEALDESAFGRPGRADAEAEIRERLKQGPVAWNTPWLMVVAMSPELTAELLATAEADAGAGSGEPARRA